MTARQSSFQSIRKTKNRVSVAISILGLVLGSGGLSLAIASSASADSMTNVYGCSFQISTTEWALQSSCSSSHEIDLPAGVSLDGNDFTISPTFAKTTNANNAAVGILGSNNVTIHDLIIDGTNEGLTLNVHGVWVPALHGINVYLAKGVNIHYVTVRNMGHSGIGVNASEVAVGNVTTGNNGWNGIDVDLGIALPNTASAVLNIVGPMTQTENAFQILVDDTRKAVTVNDADHQYAVMYFTKEGAPAAAYVLHRTGKESCKDAGWNLGLNSTQSFKNQGQCVAFFAGGDNKSHSDESGDISKSANEND